MSTKLYPLRFTPILKEKIWGGDKLSKYLNKNTLSGNIGESWEISDVENDKSIIKNGKLKGKSLSRLIKEYKHLLLGNKVYQQFNNKFPLLIKFIDAKEDLSIQLHPNDKLAIERHNSFGKTEMWYVMQADPEANLIVGFKDKVDLKQYLEKLKAKKLTEILNFEQVKEGDTYFIDVGRVHAIGSGVLLAEIQQTSDITYRLYDWDRTDSEGNERELHTDLAIDAINFNMKDNYKVGYNQQEDEPNAMVSCEYFTTDMLNITRKVEVQNVYDSFLIYICVKGKAEFSNEQFIETIEMGETLLMPACIESFKISSDNCKLLQVYI